MAVNILAAAVQAVTRPWTSGSISPTPGALVFVVVANTGSASDTGNKTASDVTATFGITGSWTLWEQANPGASARSSVHVWSARASGSPGSGTVTVNTGASPADSHIAIYERPGADATAPIVGKVGAFDTTGAPTLTLGAAPASADDVVSFATSRNDTNGATAGSGMSLVSNAFHASPSASLSVQKRTGSTSTAVPFAGLNTVHNAVMAFIVKEASGPAPAQGSAAGTWSWSGTASGARAAAGSASGSWSWLGTAAGRRAAAGVAAGLITWAGTASGAAAARGTATGTWTRSGSAVGARDSLGAAAGTWSPVGSAVGARASLGSAAGSWARDGVATGAAPANGTAAGSWSRAGAATGAAGASGTATGTVLRARTLKPQSAHARRAPAVVDWVFDEVDAFHAVQRHLAERVLSKAAFEHEVWGLVGVADSAAANTRSRAARKAAEVVGLFGDGTTRWDGYVALATWWDTLSPTRGDERDRARAMNAVFAPKFKDRALHSLSR